MHVLFCLIGMLTCKTFIIRQATIYSCIITYVSSPTVSSLSHTIKHQADRKICSEAFILISWRVYKYYVHMLILKYLDLITFYMKGW